jgi:hypothetical protein
MTTSKKIVSMDKWLGKKMFLFKMSLYGLASGVDLVRHMQPNGDLQNCWLMFDLVNHV